MAAVQICVMTAFSVVPTKVSMTKFCLIRLKKSSTLLVEISHLCGAYFLAIRKKFKSAICFFVQPLNDSDVSVRAVQFGFSARKFHLIKAPAAIGVGLDKSLTQRLVF
ncbi:MULTISPECIES: hypothetical protein [Sutterellaceae]|uniref:hypothetical protein n=1 Tax=Sutterellaceae TaxID=995019 RepID=UPI002041EBB4|nr:MULTISPECIES: hypothetical protein [Sutterellaceae]